MNNPVYLSVRLERAGRVITLPSLLFKIFEPGARVEFFCTMRNGAFGVICRWANGKWTTDNPLYRMVHVKKLSRIEYLDRLEASKAKRV